ASLSGQASLGHLLRQILSSLAVEHLFLRLLFGPKDFLLRVGKEEVFRVLERLSELLIQLPLSWGKLQVLGEIFYVLPYASRQRVSALFFSPLPGFWRGSTPLHGTSSRS